MPNLTTIDARYNLQKDENNRVYKDGKPTEVYVYESHFVCKGKQLNSMHFASKEELNKLYGETHAKISTTKRSA